MEDVRGIKVVGEAQSGETAVAFCRQHHPDVILMDMNMPEVDGVAAIQQLMTVNPSLKILALTGYDDSDLIFRAFLLENLHFIVECL